MKLTTNATKNLTNPTSWRAGHRLNKHAYTVSSSSFSSFSSSSFSLASVSSFYLVATPMRWGLSRKRKKDIMGSFLGWTGRSKCFWSTFENPAASTLAAVSLCIAKITWKDFYISPPKALWYSRWKVVASAWLLLGGTKRVYINQCVISRDLVIFCGKAKNRKH